MLIGKARLSSLAPMAAVACLNFALVPYALAGDGKIKEGDAAPAVELPATQVEKVLPDQANAKTLRLADLQGKKNVVLYFFPKAMTPGWTVEACAFRDRIEQFAQLDTVVIGISIDKVADQQKFTDKEKLNFPLFADSEREVAKKFGVLKGSYAQRVTFVIDKKGIVRKIYTKMNLRKHPDEVLAFIKENLKTKD